MYETILNHFPDTAQGHAGLGACFGLARRYTKAVPALRRVVALDPDYFEAWSFLGEALIEQGRTRDAIECFERSLAIEPYNNVAISKYLFYIAFDARFDAAQIFTLNRDWGKWIADAVGRTKKFTGRRDKKTLRIGYLSDEFREGVTARFITPVFMHRDRTRFHVTGYARGVARDETTKILAGMTDQWRDLSGRSEADAAATIRADNIDILVLCTSYRAQSRTILAYRPAPVQVCYANMVSTTGLSAVDYLITEALADPAGSDVYYTEKLVRLSRANVYMPPDSSVDSGPPPCLETGHITFASFNNIGKVTDPVVALWCRILDAVPGSRLTMKSVDRFSDPGTRAHVTAMFAARGIGPDRLEMLPGDAGLVDHLARYRAVDIALDPFPCNGGTTSLEALWMGVPVVTMAGETFMSRQGLTFLGLLGLDDLIASDAQSYVDAACRLAGDTQRLAGLRRSLRPQVESRLIDPSGHVGELERCYDEMWRRYVAQVRPAAFSVTNGDIGE
jgi:predicted O-linked N-acetylglucosamine transferase (SPINDLY family)